MTEQIRHFYDMDLSMEYNPLTGDIVKKKDLNAIRQSLQNLIEMRPFDVPFHPEIYSNIRSMLFDLYTPMTKVSLERNITTLIENYEPRVSVIDINVEDVDLQQNTNSYGIEITLTYKVINSSVTQTDKFYILRNR